MKRGHLYVMSSSRYPLRYKIGISKNPKLRREQIDQSMRGSVRIETTVKVFFPYFWEQLLHSILFLFNARMHGSGKTEWFWLFLSPIPVLLVWLCFAVETSGIIAIVTFAATMVMR